MNNIQLKIRIDAVEASYTKDGTLVVNGTGSFKFYDNKENQVRPLKFQAYGQTADTLKKSSVGSVQVISGRLTVYKPTQEYPNHRCLLTIERTICMKEGTNQVVREQQPQAMPIATVQKVPVATAAPSFAATNGFAVAVEEDLDEIPF